MLEITMSEDANGELSKMIESRVVQYGKDSSFWKDVYYIKLYNATINDDIQEGPYSQ